MALVVWRLWVALSTSHENILIALIGAFGLIVVASIPVMLQLAGNRRRLDANTESLAVMNDHMPPNGRRLYEMVEATDERTARLEQHIDRLDVLFMEHLEHHQEMK